jgi:hypothetical protein
MRLAVGRHYNLRMLAADMAEALGRNYCMVGVLLPIEARSLRIPRTKVGMRLAEMLRHCSLV